MPIGQVGKEIPNTWNCMSEYSELYEIFIAVLLWNIKIDTDCIGLLLNTKHCWQKSVDYKYLNCCKLQSHIQPEHNAQLNITGDIAVMFKKI